MSGKTSNVIGGKKRTRPIEEELLDDEMMANSSSSTSDEIVDPLSATGKYFYKVQLPLTNSPIHEFTVLQNVFQSL